MALDFELLKKHPYAIGSVVIIGGIGVLYLMSSGSTSGPAPSSDYAAALNADTQIAAVQAGVATQTANSQAQQNTAAINASVANTQTAAQLSATNTSTYAQLFSSLFSTQAAVKVQSLQDEVINGQTVAAAQEEQDNNQAALQALSEQLGFQSQVEADKTSGLTQAYALAKEIAEGGGPQAGTTLSNVLSIAQGQGSDIGAVAVSAAAPYNASAATSIANANALSSVFKTLGSVATGLFG
jgi:hypothetical protein